MRLATFDHRQFPLALLADAKGDHLVSVCLPARNEEATVGAIVERIVEVAEHWGIVDEVLVVDDHSSDRTAEVAGRAGATVVPVGDGTGKGEAVWKAVASAKGDVLVFCDADLRDFDRAFVTGLLGPLLLSDELGFVKACYDRAGEGGRVTELVARPLIALLFPDLAGFEQPLAGEFAARRDVLERVPFVQGYGVDLALLIDVAAALGIERMAQVQLGQKRHRNRPLGDLRHEAEEVLAAGLARAGVAAGSRVRERPPLVGV